jgi:hypothetical protein
MLQAILRCLCFALARTHNAVQSEQEAKKERRRRKRRRRKRRRRKRRTLLQLQRHKAIAVFELKRSSLIDFVWHEHFLSCTMREDPSDRTQAQQIRKCFDVAKIRIFCEFERTCSATLWRFVDSFNEHRGIVFHSAEADSNALRLEAASVALERLCCAHEHAHPSAVSIRLRFDSFLLPIFAFDAFNARTVNAVIAARALALCACACACAVRYRQR